MRKPKRPSGSMVVAITALFIALGGVASANAGFFDGHEIKPGTVGHQQLASHSGTVTAGLAVQLRGRQRHGLDAGHHAARAS